MQSSCYKNVTRQPTQGCNCICYIMTLSALLKQPCKKYDDINKLSSGNILTACSKHVESLEQGLQILFSFENFPSMFTNW